MVGPRSLLNRMVGEYLLVMPHVRQGPIQPDHVAGQQVELILLELLLH